MKMKLSKLIENLIAIRYNYGGDIEVKVEDTNYKKYELADEFNIRLSSNLSVGENFVALNVKKRIKGKQRN